MELSFCILTNACSSAINDVVTLSKGTLNNFDTKLNTDTDTPTAANSTDPAVSQRKKLNFSIKQQLLYTIQKPANPPTCISIKKNIQ